MTAPMASLAILTYQQEDLIEESLRSAMAQDFPDLEILVCDDGSSDETLARARAVADDDHRVRFVEATHNGGIPANATRALQACSGRYIALMAGDDLVTPDKVRKQIERMQASPDAVLCYHDVMVFDHARGKNLHRFSENLQPREGGADSLVRYGNFIAGSSVMFRADALVRTVPAWAGLCHDYFLNLEAAVHGEIVYVDEVLGRYRKHDGAVTANTDLWGAASQMLAHVEREHPMLLPQVRFARGRIYRNLARRDPDPLAKQAYARAALHARKRWPWRDLRWLVLASLGLAPSQRR